MDELIQKYLDGNLSEEEAAVFSRALADNPEMEVELNAFEQVLALASRLTNSDPSPGFTDSVMDRIAAGSHAPARLETRRPFGSRQWLPRLAWAAGFVFVFAFGFVIARETVTLPSYQTSQDVLQTASVGSTVENAAIQTGSETPFRVARLIYVPQNDNVESVSVAGTFNGWDPNGTVMRREGGVWVVQLLLPPQTYEYMIVENGEQWVTDPLAARTRDDGFGSKNAVLDLTL
jgi:anti-sigma factor RsiW